MKLIEASILLLVMFSGVAFVGWLFLFHPERVIRFHATMLRSFHKDLMGMSDEALDKGIQLPTDRFFIGRQSVYVSQGVEFPERFPRFIFAIRSLGCFIWGLLLITAILLAYAILSGKQITINGL